jgi:hypothetical protein
MLNKIYKLAFNKTKKYIGKDKKLKLKLKIKNYTFGKTLGKVHESG